MPILRHAEAVVFRFRKDFTMTQYAILANPGHNRIYFSYALCIAQQELTAVLGARGVEPQYTQASCEGLPPAVYFQTPEPLCEDALQAVRTCSFFYALFEVREGGLLRPADVPEFHTFPEDLCHILRYTGKTNEQFTRLMVNLACSACKTPATTKKLLDPMCGKGTTLYEGMVRGMDVIGIEHNAQWVQETQTFLVRYLKEGRFKHQLTRERRSAPGGKKLAEFIQLQTAARKEDYLAKQYQSVSLAHADTRSTAQLLRRNSCDLLVCDLPYGVQHASRQGAQGAQLSRSPLELLREALPGWFDVLKARAAAVLSFNVFTLSWQEAAQALEQNGFQVLSQSPYTGYQHRVDQAINRDLIVAVKPAG